MAAKKEVILTAQAPKPIGPYSQAIRSGNLLFCSGQIPLNPETGEVVSGGIREQTTQVLENIKAVLTEAGGNWDSILKTTIFLKSMTDFPVVNEIYATYFNKITPPARSTIEVSRLPKDVLVGIELIASV